MRAGLLVLALGVALGLGGCRAGQRPSLPAWRSTWERAQRVLPERAAFTPDGAKSLCGRTLAELRDTRLWLLPTPDTLLDAAAEQWLAYAESMMFDCPIDVEPDPGFDGNFRHLALLALEVETLMRAESPPSADG